MKASICIVIGFTFNYLNASNLAPITSIEADQRILTAEIAKREAAAELKSSAEQVTSFYETKESVGDRKVILRRVLVTDDARDVTEEVYRQLDDLTSYYLANKERLEIQFHNARELQAARERYKNTHPEEPQDIVLNYSRMSAPAE